MTRSMEIAREYFSEWEAVQSSTHLELLGLYRCLQSMVHRCERRFVVLRVDAQNLMGIVNRGSLKLIINELARELFWFCLRHRITTSVEWVPGEENAFADAISKMLIPEDSMLPKRFFCLLDGRWGPLIVDNFSAGSNKPLRQVLCTALVQRSCGHQRLRKTLDGGELLDELSLQFDCKIVENVARAEGVGFFANSFVGVRSLVVASVSGHQSNL
jgi:hypothetical protein